MNQERVYKVLLAPRISEKATLAADAANQFVFKVAVDANKLEVRKAVETAFSVKVEAVQVLKVKGKVKRNRYGRVKKPDWKKAYVRLADGHDIDFTAVEG